MTPLGVATKWVGVPIALLLLGRFVVGPLLIPKMPETFTKPAGDVLAEISGKLKGSAPAATSAVAPEKDSAPAQKPAATKKSNPSSAPATPSDTPSIPVTEADQSGGPQVEITAHSDSISTAKPARKHHKSKHTTVKKPPVKPEDTDTGSFGGTQDPPTNGGGTADPPGGN